MSHTAMNRKLWALVAFLVLVLAPRASAQDLPWSKTLADAMKRAKAENRPLMICMHWNEEIACRQMLKGLYRDPEVKRAMREFVLVGTSPDPHQEIEILDGGKKKSVSALFGVVSCKTLIACERAVKSEFFDTPKVVVPQHIFVHPNGEIILKKTYLLAKTPFLSLMQDAMALFTDRAVDGLAPSAKKHFMIVKKGKSKAKRQAVKSLLRMEDPRLHEMLFHTVEGLKSGRDRQLCVRAMGYDELDAATPILSRWLHHSNAKVVNCAVVSLEEVVAEGVADQLLALYAKTKNSELQKDILRSLGPCGSQSTLARTLLLKKVKSKKEHTRRACYLSLGYHLCEEAESTEIHDVLVKAWKKEGRRFLQKVAILLAFDRGDHETHIKTIKALVAKERNHQLKGLAQQIITRLKEGGEISAHASYMSVLCAGDKYKRNAY